MTHMTHEQRTDRTIRAIALAEALKRVLSEELEADTVKARYDLGQAYALADNTGKALDNFMRTRCDGWNNERSELCSNLESALKEIVC